MAARYARLTDAELVERQKLVAKHGNASKAARAIGITPRSFNESIQRAKSRGLTASSIVSDEDAGSRDWRPGSGGGAPYKDMTGQRFGKLVVLKRDGSKIYCRSKAATWLCRCDCGVETVVIGVTLRSGNNRSCGCEKRASAAKRCMKHGDAKRTNQSPEYTAWNNMKQRCFNPNGEHYDRYGGRGITVCSRWLDGDGGMSGFECFLADMGRKPSPRHSIDRKQNDGHYEPSNCRWATQKQQVRNSTQAARIQTKDGVVCLREAAERAGIPYGRLMSRRRYGWPIERALSAPVTPPRKLIVNGRQMTLNEAAKLSPISAQGISARLQKGWTPEDAVFTPPQKTGPKHARAA